MEAILDVEVIDVAVDVDEMVVVPVDKDAVLVADGKVMVVATVVVAVLA